MSSKSMPKTLLITAANRGIGLEMTRQALARGDRVIACTRNATESSDLVALAKKNDSITVLGLDVCAEKDMKQIANGMKRPIDILVCNAGVLNSYGGLQAADHDTASITSVLMTNIVGVFFTARSFLPHVLNEHRARLLSFHQRWAVKNWQIATPRFIVHQRRPRQIWRVAWLLN